jgi:hypothetical protein
LANRVGVAGLGISANIRSAYGFIADNYSKGDKIYFFGFSRGAYTARAVVSLILSLGLLTRKGMDQFYTLYNEFFHRGITAYNDTQRSRFSMHPPFPKYTIEIIGLWDTVAFDKLGKGKINLRDTFFPKYVRYGFHALALDEERSAYQPVLWNELRGAGGEPQELLQVWFSGDHLDIGGGKEDSRLSDIALVWMIDQCCKHDQLSFDIDGYLRAPNPVNIPDMWATRNGPLRKFHITHLLPSGPRTPLAYHPARGPTHEQLHCSILDRYLPGLHQADAVFWPCKPIRFALNDNWVTRRPERPITLARVGDWEVELRGQVRPYNVQ